MPKDCTSQTFSSYKHRWKPPSCDLTNVRLLDTHRSHQCVLGNDNWDRAGETLPLGQVWPKGPALNIYIKHLQRTYSGTFKSFHGTNKSICLHNREKRLKTLSVLNFQETEVATMTLSEQNMSIQPHTKRIFCIADTTPPHWIQNIKILPKECPKQCKQCKANSPEIFLQPLAINAICLDAIWLKLCTLFSR